MAFKTALVTELASLHATAEQAAAGEVSQLAEWVTSFEALSDRVGHLSAYLGCLSAADATDEAVKADEAWMATLHAGVEKLSAILRGALAALNDSAFEALLKEPSLSGAEHAVSRLREAGRRQMSTELEALASDLNVDGLHAWGRLYDTLTGKMSFEMTFPDGHSETVEMSRRRALMSEPDRRLREAAFHAGQKPWLDHADTLAAGLNGIAGTRLSLYAKRGLGHFLDTPLFDGAMSRAST